MVIKEVFSAHDLTRQEQEDIRSFIADASGLHCLSDPEADTQVWVSHSGALVFKVFDIRRFKQRFRARWKLNCPGYGKRYGWSERHNAQQFSEHGLMAPPVRAYMETSNALLCRRQVVAYPYLTGFSTLQDVLASSRSPFSALATVASTITAMVAEGVFHMDLNTRNIMLDGDGRVSIIDFEYMAWNRREPGALFAYYFGYLYQKWACKCLDEAEYDAWFQDILQERQGTFPDSAEGIATWYETGKSKELSRAERYRIFS